MPYRQSGLMLVVLFLLAGIGLAADDTRALIAARGAMQPSGTEIIGLRDPYSRHYSNGDGTITAEVYQDPIPDESQQGGGPRLTGVTSIYEETPEKDAYVSRGSPGNHGRDLYLYSGWHYNFWRDSCRSYLYFNTASIPSGSSVDSATLRLYCSGTYGIAPGLFTASRVTSLWEEDLINWANKPGYASEGGAGAWLQVNAWTVWTPTVIVQYWLDNPGSNFGFVITSGAGFAEFHARENVNKPRLRIVYQPSDVGMWSIVAPRDTVEMDTTITPRCFVYSSGTRPLSYGVRTKIGSSYDQTVNVSNHTPQTTEFAPQADAKVERTNGDENFGGEKGLMVAHQTFGQLWRTFIKFNLSAIPLGSHVEFAKLSLYQTNPFAVDDWYVCSRATGHDWREDSLTWNNQPDATAEDEVGAMIYGWDVGWVDWYPTAIVQHWIDEPATNYGFRLKLGSEDRWREASFLSKEYGRDWPRLTLSYRPPRLVDFPAWVAVEAGLLAVGCSTRLQGDQANWNDRMTGSVFVRRRAHDVLCQGIGAPTGTVRLDTSLTPACTVYNRGSSTETYTVQMKIGDTYSEQATVTGHVSDTRIVVNFPTWTASEPGVFVVKCSTTLATDRRPSNDRKTGQVVVNAHDVSCTDLLTPRDSVDFGSTSTPTCSTYYWGPGPIDYGVRTKVGTLYDRTVTVGEHPDTTVVLGPDRDCHVEFDYPDRNYGRDDHLRVGRPFWSANRRRAYIHFDLNTIPREAAVRDARLSLYCDGAYVFGDLFICSRADNSWTEYGTTWNYQPKWNIKDEVGTVISGANTWVDWHPTVIAQSWVDNPDSNSGFCVRHADEGMWRSAEFRSREYSDPAYRPVLRVRYRLKRHAAFPAWTAAERGPLVVSCSTRFAGDTDPTNDRKLGSVFVRYHDAGCIGIEAPPETVSFGAMVVPACTVRNHGNMTESYAVRFRIGDSYQETTYVTDQDSGTTRVVTFPSWTASVPGWHAISCSTELAKDNDNTNDRAIDSVFVYLFPDVACTALEAIPDTVDSGETVAPACSVYNAGNVTVDYRVRLRIDGFYEQTDSVFGHAPGTFVRVAFPEWVAQQRGSHAVTCSTELAGDARPENDRATGTVFVRVLDVAALSVSVPGPVHFLGEEIFPEATWSNQGNLTADFEASMILDNPVADSRTYAEKVRVHDLAPGADTLVDEFPGKLLTVPGNWTYRCSTYLAGDMVPNNDIIDGSFFVARQDIGVTAILAPAGMLRVGQPVTPAAKVKNLGDWDIPFKAWFTITDSTGSGVYEQMLEVAGLPVGAETLLSFPSWQGAPAAGDYSAICSTYASYDVEPANNVLRTEFLVTDWNGGWFEVASMPPGQSGLDVSSGAWLVNAPRSAGSPRVFATKGNRCGEFYCYDAVAGTWSARAGIPLGIERVYPDRGCKAAVCPSDNAIYMTKGNNTLAFWRYRIEQNDWQPMAQIPLGKYGLKVKDGTDLAYVNSAGGEFVYLLKGGLNEFLRYDIAANVWQERQPVPYLTTPVYHEGSWLVWDRGPYLYAHQATMHTFWKYDVSADTWFSRPLTGIPRIGGSGHPQMSKDGGSADWDQWTAAIYALKGGDCGEFWKYEPPNDLWTELAPMPDGGSSGKKKGVGAGGDIVSFRFGSFFALKGNSTREFWRYVPGEVVLGRAPSDGVTAGTIDANWVGLLVRPNPLSLGAATIRYGLPSAAPARISVHDVAGRVAYRCDILGRRSGVVSLNLAELSTGVYLVRLDAHGWTATQKLVVQR